MKPLNIYQKTNLKEKTISADSELPGLGGICRVILPSEAAFRKVEADTRLNMPGVLVSTARNIQRPLLAPEAAWDSQSFSQAFQEMSPTDPPCSVSCSAVTSLEAKNRVQAKVISGLKNLIKNQGDRLNQPDLNSTNSGISPSHDFGRGRPANGQPEEGQPEEGQVEPQKRSRGGQPGHPRHTRPPLTEEEAFENNEHDIESGLCPDCGSMMDRRQDFDKQFDHIRMPDNPIELVRDVFLGYWCPHCQKVHHPHIPDEIRNRRLLDHSFVAMLGVARGDLTLSISGIQKSFKYFYKLDISRGYIVNQLKEMMWALRAAYHEAEASVRLHTRLNADDTMYKHMGKRGAVWVFGADDLGFYRIATRSAFILGDVLGTKEEVKVFAAMEAQKRLEGLNPEAEPGASGEEGLEETKGTTIFRGVLTSDYHSSFRCYGRINPHVVHQYCMAHLIRDFQQCEDHGDPAVSEYGRRVKPLVQGIVHLNNLRKAEMKAGIDTSSVEFQMDYHKWQIIHEATTNVPKGVKSKARCLSQRFEDDPLSYFTFMKHVDVEPTNNFAEQLLRTVVISRYICKQTQSWEGIKGLETFITCIQTLRLQSRDPIDFFAKSMEAAIAGQAPPSLINPGKEVAEEFRVKAREEKVKFMAEARAERKKNKEKRLKYAENRARKAAEPESRQNPDTKPDKGPNKPRTAPEDEDLSEAECAKYSRNLKPEKIKIKKDPRDEAPPEPKPKGDPCGEAPPEPKPKEDPRDEEPPKPKPKGDPRDEAPPEPRPKTDPRKGRPAAAGLEPHGGEPCAPDTPPVSPDQPDRALASMPSKTPPPSKKPPETPAKGVSRPSKQPPLREPGIRQLKAPESADRDSGACLKGPHRFPSRSKPAPPKLKSPPRTRLAK
jgi:hypothetical protein